MYKCVFGVFLMAKMFSVRLQWPKYILGMNSSSLQEDICARYNDLPPNMTQLTYNSQSACLAQYHHVPGSFLLVFTECLLKCMFFNTHIYIHTYLHNWIKAAYKYKQKWKDGCVSMLFEYLFIHVWNYLPWKISRHWRHWT